MLKNFSQYLNNHPVKSVSIHHHAAFTAQEQAESIHVSGDHFAKTVILNADNKYVMAVLPATHLIDLKLLKDVVHAQRLELIHEEEAMRLFPDCEIGAMPPFGNIYNMPTYVDRSLICDDDIYFNSTKLHDAIRMKYKDYQNLVHPVIGRFSKHV